MRRGAQYPTAGLKAVDGKLVEPWGTYTYTKMAYMSSVNEHVPGQAQLAC